MTDRTERCLFSCSCLERKRNLRRLAASSPGTPFRRSSSTSMCLQRSHFEWDMAFFSLRRLSFLQIFLNMVVLPICRVTFCSLRMNSWHAANFAFQDFVFTTVSTVRAAPGAGLFSSDLSKCSSMYCCKSVASNDRRSNSVCSGTSETERTRLVPVPWSCCGASPLRMLLRTA